MAEEVSLCPNIEEGEKRCLFYFDSLDTRPKSHNNKLECSWIFSTHGATCTYHLWDEIIKYELESPINPNIAFQNCY
jgi:hypothetical protein